MTEARTSRDTSPIATVDQFKKALLALRDKKKLKGTPYLELLRAHCDAPEHRVTAARLASSVQPPLANYGAANLQYGKLAHLIADELGYSPPQRADKQPMWWHTLSICDDEGEDPLDDHFVWKMRPELVAALQEMRWATKPGTAGNEVARV